MTNLIDAIHTMDGLLLEIAVIHELTKDGGPQGLADSIVYAASSPFTLTREERAEAICKDLFDQGYADVSTPAMSAIVHSLHERLNDNRKAER